MTQSGVNACWVAWIGGTILIVLSWCGVVPNAVGWLGFAVAALAAMTSRTPGRSFLAMSESRIDQEVLLLTDAQLASQDQQYRTTMDRFGQGATLVYQDVFFALREPAQLACAMMASYPAEEMNDPEALEQASRAREVFQTLEQNSSQFAFAARDRWFRVSLFYDYGMERVELCQIMGDEIRRRYEPMRLGSVEWLIAGKEQATGARPRDLPHRAIR